MKLLTMVGSLLLSSVICLPVFAASKGTGSAADIMALSDANVAALKENFSTSGQVLTQHGGEKVFQAICQGCHMPQGQGAKGWASTRR